MDDARTAAATNRRLTTASPAVPGPDPAVASALSTLVIAVDGPSGSGKSTVARLTAQRLGLRYLDTGAMYRAVTRKVLDAGDALDDAAAVARTAAALTLQPSTDPAAPAIAIDGEDLTAAVRTAAVTEAVSAVSAVPAVRSQLVALQRELIGTGGIVVEGRDIGTTVAPEAPVKIYLVADAAVRADRRTLELTSSREARVEADSAAVEASLRRRDTLDSTRAASPLTRAPDAVEIDTTALAVDAVVDRVVAIAMQACRPDQDAMREAGRLARRSRPRLVRAVGRPHPALITVARRFGHWLFHRVFVVRVSGLDQVPTDGPVLLAGNHTGFLDGPLVFSVTPRNAVYFIKSDLYRGGILDRLLGFLGQIPINRGRPDRPALRQGRAALAAGQVVGMFPEGTRGSGDLSSIQHGVGYLAVKSGAPVVPVACFGTDEALPKGRKLPAWRTPVDVVFGEPFVVDLPGDPSARRVCAEAAEVIRTHLRAHLVAARAATGRSDER